jgi:PAS domain S-box-containing protein
MRLSLLLLTALVAIPGLSFANGDKTPHIVLVNSGGVNGSNRDLRVTEELKGKVAPLARLSVEFLETDKYVPLPQSPYAEKLAALYAEKYGQGKTDIIIAVGAPALQFLNSYRDAVFGQVPVIFFGTERPASEFLQRGFTGFTNETDLEASVDFIHKVLPGVKTIYVLCDNTSQGTNDRKNLERASISFKEYFQFIFLDDGLGLDELSALKKAGDIPPGCALLDLGFSRDRYANEIDSDAFLKKLCAASASPVFCRERAFLASGAIGGQITSEESLANAIVEDARLLLRGAKAADIPVRFEPTTPMVNLHAMRRFKIQARSIPQGTRIVDPDKASHRRTWTIIGYVSGAAAETLILIALVALFLLRRRDQNELAAQGRVFRKFFEILPIGSAVIKDRVLQNVNLQVQKMLGYSSEELIGQNSRFLYASDEAYNSAGETLYKNMSLSEGGIVETKYLRKDGVTIDVRLYANVIDPDDRDNGILVSILDITEQNRASSRQKESEAKYRTLFESAYDAIFLIKDGLFLDCNPRAETLLDTLKEGLMGKSILDFSPKYQSGHLRSETMLRDIFNGAKSGEPKTFSWVFDRPNRGEVITEVSLSPHGAPESGFFQAMVRDRTEEFRFQERLERSEELFRTIFETSPNIITIVSRRDGRYLLVNPAFERATHMGLEDVVDKTNVELGFYSVESYSDFIESLPERGKIESKRLTFTLPSGEVRQHIFSAARIVFSGEPAILTMGTDITDAQRMEEELNQARKMEVVGQLAGGIAHDFNNLLGGIMGSAEMLGLLAEGQPDILEYAKTIKDTTERAADLTRKLLAFSRKAKAKTVPFDVHGSVTSAISLLERSIDKNIKIEGELTAPRSVILGDTGLLQNAFINLGLNARDAMPNGGRLLFKSDLVTINAEELAADPFLPQPGVYIRIAVSDTGTGISPEVLPKIFEPFFTTKAVGKGTGLGLAALYGTVKDHQGGVKVLSELGKGTTFYIYLPLSERRVPSTEASAPKNIPLGEGSVLVVDDEPVIRATTGHILSSLGYTPILAASCHEAISLFSQAPGRFHAVLLDLVMPDMSGRELLRRLIGIEPRVKAIFISGYDRESRSDEGFAPNLIGYIQKPFTRAEIAALLSKLSAERI